MVDLCLLSQHLVVLPATDGPQGELPLVGSLCLAVTTAFAAPTAVSGWPRRTSFPVLPVDVPDRG